jgi:hypothetical protein
LVALLAAVALVVKPPAPPGIAEFAPQATKPITKALPGQSSVSGAAGPGGCPVGQSCAPSAAAAGPAKPVPLPLRSRPGGVATTKQCYAWPDGSVTQTWDPQSPPCIADWPGRAKGNGGATTRGVTGSSIRIALPWSESFDYRKPLVDFFNSHFELYGRRLVLVPFKPQESSDDSAQQADAEAVASLGPFAATANPFGDPNPTTYTSRLAAAKVISVSGANEVPVGSEARLRRSSPYSWSYSPTSADLLAVTATMACRQLVGRPASRSGDPGMRTRTRTFAIVVPDQKFLPGRLDGLQGMRDQLAACGAGQPRVVEYQRVVWGDDPSPIASAMLQLKNDGVTSVFFWPKAEGASSAGAPQVAASGVGYNPEWILPGWSVGDASALTSGAPDQVRSSFGVASWSHIPPLVDRPFYRAYSETTGGDPPEAVREGQQGTYEAIYRYLQVIASGVQLAGPQLDPQAFEKALQEQAFPNPGAGASPDYQATVGYDGDHVAVDDFAFFWFNARTPPQAGSIAVDPFCYGHRAQRWTSTTWPKGGDPFSAGSC